MPKMKKAPGLAYIIKAKSSLPGTGNP